MKYKSTPLTQLTDFARLICLLFFVIILSAAYTWNYQPQWVSSLDKHIVVSYTSHYQERFIQAETAVKESNSFILANELMADLASIKNMDRLAPIKRNTFNLLVTEYENQKNFEEAIYWLQQWNVFDGQDLEAQVREAKAMYQTPDKKELGIQALSKLHNLVPEAGFISLSYYNILVAEKDYLEAFNVALRHLSKNTPNTLGSWRVFWDLGTGFTGEQSALIESGSKSQQALEFSLRLPKNITQLRIDPPPQSRLIISQPRISTTTQDLNLMTVKLTMHDTKNLGDYLITTGGGDPYFYFKIPDSISSIENFQFSTIISTLPPQWLEELTTGIISTDARKAIVNSNNAALLEEFNNIGLLFSPLNGQKTIDINTNTTRAQK